MSVTNRKLFNRGARDELRRKGGIMASSEPMMQAVGYENGGQITREDILRFLAQGPVSGNPDGARFTIDSVLYPDRRSGQKNDGYTYNRPPSIDSPMTVTTVGPRGVMSQASPRKYYQGLVRGGLQEPKNPDYDAIDSRGYGTNPGEVGSLAKAFGKPDGRIPNPISYRVADSSAHANLFGKEGSAARYLAQKAAAFLDSDTSIPREQIYGENPQVTGSDTAFETISQVSEPPSYLYVNIPGVTTNPVLMTERDFERFEKMYPDAARSSESTVIDVAALDSRVDISNIPIVTSLDSTSGSRKDAVEKTKKTTTQVNAENPVRTTGGRSELEFLDESNTESKSINTSTEGALSYEELLKKAESGSQITENNLVKSVEAGLLNDQQAADINSIIDNPKYMPSQIEQEIAKTSSGRSFPNDPTNPDLIVPKIAGGVSDFVAGAFGGRTIGEQKNVDAERQSLKDEYDTYVNAGGFENAMNGINLEQGSKEESLIEYLAGQKPSERGGAVPGGSLPKFPAELTEYLAGQKPSERGGAVPGGSSPPTASLKILGNATEDLGGASTGDEFDDVFDKYVSRFSEILGGDEEEKKKNTGFALAMYGATYAATGDAGQAAMTMIETLRGDAATRQKRTDQIKMLALQAATDKESRDDALQTKLADEKRSEERQLRIYEEKIKIKDNYDDPTGYLDTDIGKYVSGIYSDVLTDDTLNEDEKGAAFIGRVGQANSELFYNRLGIPRLGVKQGGGKGTDWFNR